MNGLIVDKSEQAPVIIIGGGVGPLAGVNFHRQLIEQSKHAKFDQDHADVIHVSLSSRIPDRTDFLLDNKLLNPGLAMAELLKPVIKNLDQQGRQFLIVIPCVTFHSPRILDKFLEAIGSGSARSFVSLLDAGLFAAKHSHPELPIGVLATSGSRSVRLWSAVIEAGQGCALEIPDELQMRLQNAIYNPMTGLKSATPPTKAAIDAVQRAVNYLEDRGARSIILGCTELSLVKAYLNLRKASLIDPCLELANDLVAKPHEIRARNTGFAPMPISQGRAVTRAIKYDRSPNRDFPLLAAN